MNPTYYLFFEGDSSGSQENSLMIQFLELDSKRMKITHGGISVGFTISYTPGYFFTNGGTYIKEQARSIWTALVKQGWK